MTMARCRAMTPTRRTLLTAAALAASSAILPAGPARAAKDTIKIGATLPLTGAEARIGGFYKEGYEYAFEQQNNKGGVKVSDKTMKVELQLLDHPGRGAERGRRAEPDALRERRRRRERDLQARVQVGVRPPRAGRAVGRLDDEGGRRAPEGGQAAQAGEDRAALGKHLAREGLPQGRERVRQEERRRLPGGGRRVVRAERQGLQRAARQGEGGRRRPVP